MASVWAVTGAKFAAESARAETFKNTSGARGVTLPEDLRVRALPTPGPFVRVAAGGATLPANYPLAPGQSYGTYQATSVDVPVPATGAGSAVTRYLIQRITDPQYEGNPPSDPVNADYSRFAWVSSLTGLSYPYVELCRLIQPANTSTITEPMLTDLRQLAKPRNHRELLSSAGSPDSNLTTLSPAWQQWPNYTPTIEIPEWANHFKAIGRVHAAGLANGTSFGGLRMELGTASPRLIYGQSTAYDINTPGQAGNGVRIPTLSMIMTGYLSPDWRGTSQRIRIVGNKGTIVNESGYLVADGTVQTEFDIYFMERVY